MLIIDKALEQRHREGNPIRVGMVGAGYMGRGAAYEILTSIPGMRLAAISNRTASDAQRVYAQANIQAVRVDSTRGLQTALTSNGYAFTDDPMLLCEADELDVIIEATGTIEFGARVAIKAIESGKHVVLMNAELDATLGPILKVYADRAGVVITNTDGDEPGVAMNLFRFVKSIGYQPVLAGNIKGFIDRHRTPETQREFASKHDQEPLMITSFADGTKLSMECTILANATGLKAGKRGMHGYRCTHVKDLLDYFSPDDLLQEGLVDYSLGAEPGTGAFVVGYNNDPIKAQYMNYFKMGKGPLYMFYTPYHLPHLQLPSTVARAVLFNDATVAPLGAPVCDVITMAKRDMISGEILDGIGGFTSYGAIENYGVSRARGLLPMGLSENCRLRRSVRCDTAIRYDDIELPAERLCDHLRNEQCAYFDA